MMSAHETESAYERYNIAATGALLEAAKIAGSARGSGGKIALGQVAKSRLGVRPRNITG
jgi:hypothetical protein